MIDYLMVFKFELMGYGEEMMSEKLGRALEESDLSLLEDIGEATKVVERYLKEWKVKKNVQAIDEWLRRGGYEKVAKTYLLEEALWLADFQLFFQEVWEDIPEDMFMPSNLDWAFYHEVRGKGIKGCSNFGFMLERYCKIMIVEAETNEILGRLSKVRVASR